MQETVQVKIRFPEGAKGHPEEEEVSHGGGAESGTDLDMGWEGV